MAGGKGSQKSAARPKGGKKAPQSGGRLRSWLLLGVALCLVGGYFYFVGWPEMVSKEPTAEIPKHTVEKTGAGANVDFTDKTEQIHRVVEEALKEQGLSILDTKREQKSVKRQGVEGEIRWSAQELPVSATEEEQKALREKLARFLPKIGAELLAEEAARYRGQSIWRMDIGITDSLEGDPVTIVADRLYIARRQEKPSQALSPPAVGSHPKIALVIDDFGYTKAPIEAYRHIACPLTFAILPNHPYSKEAARIGHADGRQLILHLPMEAMSDQAKEEPLTIHVGMNEADIRAMVRELTDSVPYIIGVNNHQGSRATSNRRVMGIVLGQLAEQGLFFIDSKTSGSSLAYAAAREAGVPAAENRLFIDNSSDIKLIKAQLNKATEIAAQSGQVIVIGHARQNTAAALQEMVPALEARGFQFVFASTLLR